MNLEKKKSKLAKKLSSLYPSIKVSLKDDCVVINGTLPTYNDVLTAGKIAATYGFYGVINEATFAGIKPQIIHHSSINDKTLDGKKVDVLVIGGGVIGSAILRELSKYSFSSLLVEKEEDVAMEASSHNDGCLHVGLDLHKGSKKLSYLLRARKMIPEITTELGVKTRLDGQSVAFTSPWLKIAAPFIKLHGAMNHIPGGVKIMSKKKMKEIEPNIGSDVSWGLFMPAGGSISPYLFTIALAENAIHNGAQIALNTFVTGMEVKDHQIISVKTNRGTIYPHCVINAAGAFSDDIAEMADDRFFTIHPRKGTDIIMDKAVYHSLSKTGITVFSLKANLSKNHTKGGGIIPTIDENSLVGPDASETPDKEDFSVDRSSIDAIFSKHKKTIESLSERDIIAYFAGERAATYEEDFVVQKGKWTKNIVHAAGIQSPGLTAAPAIAEDVAKWASEIIGSSEKKKDFDPIRKPIVETRYLSNEDRDALIKKNPAYGHIVCRCEEISEGEILDALHGNLPATTIDGVKRRVRAGMGRCQGGFCQMLVSELISNEFHIPLGEVKKKGEGNIILSKTKSEPINKEEEEEK